MSIIEELQVMGHRMVGEQANLRDLLSQERMMSVRDESIDGIDRLIYNHCLNKSELAVELDIRRNLLSKLINQMVEQELIPDPIQGRGHLYSRETIQVIMKQLNMVSYSDTNHSIAIAIENQKGGTGKSSSAVTLAVKTALDLTLNARVCLIDFDPQGTLATSLIQNINDDETVILTAVDIVLGNIESDSDFAEYKKADFDDEEIVLAAPFSTYLPNLDIIAAHPFDERFNDVIATCSEEEEQALYVRFRDVLVNTLKQKYDIIIFDTAPHDAAMVWAVNECVDGILIPVMPNEFDFSSTSNFINSLPSRLEQLPRHGENIKWLKVLPVNYNEKSTSQRKTLAKLTRTVQDRIFSTQIKNSELFPAAAAVGRTVLDVKKSEELVSKNQFELAVDSVNSVYSQFKNEIIAISVKDGE